jgi:predicted short-subunit dehydrogenase-like oxidoreductase (DUF2520 family)
MKIVIHSDIQMKYRIGFIGAGKVAWHLAPALAQSGNHVLQVISRSPLGAQKLADRLGCRYTDRIADLDKDLQVIFLTVPDHALIDIISDISDYRGIVVHTSGTSSPMRFACQKYKHGGLYPLQTFTIGRPVDMSKIPVFIEGSEPEVTQIIRNLAEGFTSEVYELSPMRKSDGSTWQPCGPIIFQTICWHRRTGFSK